jgi:zinc ribbon protein
MSTAELAPVPGSIDNPGDWPAVTQRITQLTALPMPVGPDQVLALVSSGVALMFEAQSSGNIELLRGVFAAPVVAQCQANADGLLSGHPTSVAVHLAAGRVVDGHGVLRLHLEVHGQRADGSACVDRQFWDLQLGAQVTVAKAACPNCGAPVAGGELICSHCGTDVRAVVDVPAVVSRLELY